MLFSKEALSAHCSCSSSSDMPAMGSLPASRDDGGAGLVLVGAWKARSTFCMVLSMVFCSFPKKLSLFLASGAEAWLEKEPPPAPADALSWRPS